MKTRYLVLSLLMSLALGMSARTFEVGERLYFNGTPNGFPTWKNDAELWVQFKKVTGENYWLKANWIGDLPYVEMNSESAGEWTHVVMARCEPNVGFNNIYNQTGDITIYENKNYIENFCYGEGWRDAYWGTYIPAPTNDPLYWPMGYDDEELCTDAVGKQYVLYPKNREYGQRTNNHAWFEYNGSAWVRLQGNDEWHEASEKDYSLTLGDAGYDRFFFYQCSTPSLCRLVRIRLNQDCSPGAPGACKITSFAAVASDANVTDQTCAIDGLVAFDDKLNAGDLKIWCGDIDTVILNEDLEMPQTFKLKGFDASSTKTYTLNAKFLNGTSECEATCQVTVRPPTAPIKIHTTTGTGAYGSHDLDLVRFTEEDVTLTPDNQRSTYFQWTNSADEYDINIGEYPEPRAMTFTAPTEEMDIDYIFLATNDPPSPEGNLISNGNFEYAEQDELLESNYDFWGRDKKNYYKDNPGASGGYAITDRARAFWRDYQNVTAHEGDYFGLFDSKSYTSTDMDDQAAWIARSGRKNPELRVQAGVSYLFSFWVANINTYYQMDNGARLQFQISYDGGTTWNNLGEEINLGAFKDSRWHGRSSIATPTTTSDDVVLRVINRNKSSVNIGNDFALDDIRFEAITSQSSNIAAYERFPVRYLKCVIDTATFVQSQPVGCGTTVANVAFEVDFVHPRGDLYIYEGDKELAHFSHFEVGDETTSFTGFLRNQPVDNKDHTLTVYFDDGNVRTDAPRQYVYNAKAVPSLNLKSLAWGEVGCDDTKVTLTAVIEYTNQNGYLTADVDGKPAKEPVIYDGENDDLHELTLAFPGLVADGKTGHVLNVNFDGSHGCSIVDYAIPTAAPYMPSVTMNTPEIQPYLCSDRTYDVKVSASFANGQAHDIIFKDVDTGDEIRVPTAAGDRSAEAIFSGYSWDNAPATHQYNVYFDGATTCDHKKSFTSPTPSRITPSFDVTVSPTACGTLNYSLSGTVNFTAPDGDLIVEYDADHRAVVSLPEGSTSANFVINGMTEANDMADATAPGMQLRAWFSNQAGSPACVVRSQRFFAPVVPSVDTLQTRFLPIGCQDKFATLSFDLAYTNQQGTFTYWVDDILPKQTADYLKGNTNENELNGLLFGNIPADGKQHTLHVEFSDANSCKPTYLLPAVPLSYAIDTVDVTGVPATVLCGEETYNVNVVVETPYDMSGETIIVQHGNNATPAYATGKKTTIPVTLDIFSADQITLAAAFASAPECMKTSNLFSTPIQATCVKDEAVVCEGEPYLWEHNNKTYGPFWTIGVDTITDDANPKDSLIVTVMPQPEITLLKVDTVYEDAAEIHLPYSIKKGDPNLFEVTIAGATVTLPASDELELVVPMPAGLPTGDNIATVKVRNANLNCFMETSVTFHVAGVPTVTGITVTPLDVPCGAASYSVNVHVTYMNPRGNLIVEDLTNGRTISCPVAKIPYGTVASLDSVIDIASFEPATLNWQAYFVGRAAMTATSALPTLPVINIKNVNHAIAGCSKTSDVTFDLDYTYQRGTLSYWVDGMEPKTETFLADDPNRQTLTSLSFTGIPADGKDRCLHVKFDGLNSCEDSVLLSALFTPVIESVVVVPNTTTVRCDEFSYTANVTINTPYDATGRTVALTYEGNSTPITLTGNPTTAVLTLTTLDAKGLTIDASFIDATGAPGSICSTTSDPFDAPTQWTCIKDTATICLGDSYPWNVTGLSYSPATVGLTKIDHNYDTLYLFVKAEPAIRIASIDRVCDDETEISWPFTVTAGTPDIFSVNIAGKDYPLTVKGSDLVLSPAPALTAGDYPLTFTIGDSEITCTSTVSATLSVALSGRMYSKWTDVLFIDNSASVYVAYQWYNNGVEMAGETQQRLYDSNGLPGTYYCRLTTADGSVFYTCAQSFDEVTPSRTVDTSSKIKTVAVYDPMGRLVTGKLNKGIYIIVEEVNGEMRTRKIAIYE